MQEYLQAPARYELRPGSAKGAPPCPYGNQFEWVGYDKETETYVRFTKSVFKLLVRKE
jgi:hypothetical protein